MNCSAQSARCPAVNPSTVLVARPSSTRGRRQGAVARRETGQEILTESDPLRRYGIGVLYDGAAVAGDLTWVPGLPDSDETSDAPVTPAPAALRDDEPDSDDFDLTDANTFKPRAMAVSFKCRIAEPGSLSLTVTGAYYDSLAVHVGGYSKPWEWWVRRPFTLHGEVPGELVANRTRTLLEIPTRPKATLRVRPNAQVFSRPVPGELDPHLRLVTVAVINTASGSGPSAALFQMSFEVQPQGGVTIEPYPEVEQPDSDEEEQSIDLLYRNKRTFAIGHGCAADWSDPVAGTTLAVRAAPMPAYEVPSLTPNVYVAEPDGNRRPVLVSMRALADGTAEGRAQVETVLSLYDSWIAEREAEIGSLIERFRPAATRHMELCRNALARMRAGWQMIADTRSRLALSASPMKRCSTSSCDRVWSSVQSSTGATAPTESWVPTRSLSLAAAPVCGGRSR